jgi:PAS domain S-box-containing protein
MIQNKSDHRPLHVLFVDDRPEDVERCAVDLRQAGFAVLAERVASAAEVSDRLRETAYDVVLTEHEIPGCTWREVLKIVQPQGVGIPVIVVTSKVAEEIGVRAIDEGASDCILKDRLVRLAPAVRRALRARDYRTRAQQEASHLHTRAEEARAEAQAATRYWRLWESAPDAILEVDREGRIVLINAEAERLFRYSREELVGMPVELLIPDRFRTGHSRYRGHYSEHPSTRPMGSGLELWARRKDGAEFAVDINLSPVEPETGDRVMCVVRDVTEKKRAQEEIRLLNLHLERRSEELAASLKELEVRNRDVEKANRLKSEFLASMSHELRTPLNSIIGFGDLLAEGRAGDLNQKQKRFLGHIQNGARHLLELINDILDLSKIEAGRLELRYETFGVVPALNEVLASVKPLATTKSILLESAAEDVQVYADRVRFKEILYNLISNALKFTPDTGRVWVESGVRDGLLYMSVCDTGIGIPTEEHHSIFDKFHQVAASTKGVREGTGLGLAITKRLIELHGGRIWLESEPGKGSQFHFVLPLLKPKDQAPAPAAAPLPVERRSPLILIVEDEPSSQELMARYLESEGYRTVAASSGTEGIRKAREHVPDAITLDMLMPGRSGWETLYELRNTPETAQIPIIIVSVVEETRMGFALGANEYLIKPVSKEALLESVHRHVRKPGDDALAPVVLAVDDDSAALRLMEEVLREGGCTPLAARTGEEALAVLDREPVEAVVLDLMLPGMNGLEVLHRIRENPKLRAVPVVVVTGKELTDGDVAFLNREATTYLQKGSPWQSQLLEQLRFLTRRATAPA